MKSIARGHLMQLSVKLIAVILSSAAIVGIGSSSAMAASGKLTMRVLIGVGDKAANELIDTDWTDNDFGSNIVDYEGTCKLTGALRGTCAIEYEFDDGAFCDDTVRVAKRSLKSSKITYWSDSNKADDGGYDDVFDNCTESTETDPDAEE